jgi:glycosyltransferase involved in cell wall biosynthesis
VPAGASDVNATKYPTTRIFAPTDLMTVIATNRLVPSEGARHLDRRSGVALVHDYLLVLRGAERTFAAMTDEWPESPITTLLYDEAGTNGRFAGRDVRTSPLQRLGLGQRDFRALLALYPAAVRRLAPDGDEAVVSSSSAFAHGVRTPPGAVHVCYCHTPFRYAWMRSSKTFDEVPTPLRPALALALYRHRAFDRRAAGGVDQFVANSRLTQERIRRFWGREAPVVHPPVDVERFSIGEPGEHVLFVGELVAHKRADLAIAAALGAGRRIKVVGAGPELERLRSRHGPEVEFLGRVGDAELADLYAGAAALVVPNVEEFGIAAVEAQAAGRPVVALDAGGTRETVLPGRTGVLVSASEPSALERALRGDLGRFDPHEIRANSLRFSSAAFRGRLREIVEATRARGPLAVNAA